MDKQKLLEKIIEQLTENYQVIEKSAKFAREYATHEDARAENQYDTRGLESAYLAEAQSKRALEIARALTLYQSMKVRSFGEDEPIAVGALVELESDRETTACFLGPAAGGMKVELDDTTVSVITPQSPLGRNLLGKRVDDDVDLVIRGSNRQYVVIAVW